MMFKIRFPIRYKILALLAAMVLGAVTIYLVLASRVLFEDKALLLYEINRLSVKTLASQVERRISQIEDQLRSVTRLESASAVREQLKDSPEILSIRVWKNRKVQFETIWVDRFKLDEIKREEAIKIVNSLDQSGGDEQSSLNLKRIESGAFAFVKAALKQSDTLVVALLRADAFTRSFEVKGVTAQLITDLHGNVLVATGFPRNFELTGEALNSVSRAHKAKGITEVRVLEQDGKRMLLASSPIGRTKMVAVTQVAFERASEAARKLFRKSLLYGAIIVTAAFLVALFFSDSLTRPIRSMVEATQVIAAGDLNTHVQVSSNDELQILAASFNSMTSNLKNSREKIERANAELESRVLERTEQLEKKNTMIQETQEALLQTTRLASVGEVAGRAAHEVLNPLTAMMARLEKIRDVRSQGVQEDLKLAKAISEGWLKDYQAGGIEGLMDSLKKPSEVKGAKILLEEDLRNLVAVCDTLAKSHQESRQDTEFLLAESQRISKIVNGMRQLTRVSTNRKLVDLHATIRQAATTIADNLDKRKIKFEEGFCSGSPRVYLDADELLQVLSNLFRNSMQAFEGQPGGHKIWVTTQMSGPRVLVRVSDNGPGIPPQNIGKIFEPSFTTKSAETGTGLGLSIARRLVRAADGEIVLEKSVSHEETTFLLDFPEGPQS